MFRQIKEMKAMLEGAPGAQALGAQALAAQAQHVALAQQAVPVVRQPGGRQAGGIQGGYAYQGRNFEPVAGVSLDQYAAIVKCAAGFGHDPAKMAEVAEARGISSVAWQMAVTGWNARLRGDAAVARRFNLRYWES